MFKQSLSFMLFFYSSVWAHDSWAATQRHVEPPTLSARQSVSADHTKLKNIEIASQSQKSESQTLDPAGLAAYGLKRNQLANGLFLYDYDFIKDRGTGNDNMVRQAGVTESLAFYAMHRTDPLIISAANRALQSLWSHNITESAEKNLWVNNPTFSKFSPYLGTTALALLASEWLNDPNHPKQTLDLMQRKMWLATLVAAWRPELQGFIEQPMSHITSGYYDGEAWLAIAAYVKRHPAEVALNRWLNQVDTSLMKRYSGWSTSFYSWGAHAASIRYASHPRPELVTFSKQQAKYALKKVPPANKYGMNYCVYTAGLAANGITLATAAAKQQLDAEGIAILAHIRKRVASDLAYYTAHLQIKPGQTEFVYTHDNFLHNNHIKDFSGLFRSNYYASGYRNDFSQHCIDAYLLAGELG